MMTAPASLGTLREEVDAGFTHRRHALVALVDALPTADPVPSPVHFSLTPAQRRGWGSVSAAPTRGRLDIAALRTLLARRPLADGRPIYAVDRNV